RGDHLRVDPAGRDRDYPPSPRRGPGQLARGLHLRRGGRYTARRPATSRQKPDPHIGLFVSTHPKRRPELLPAVFVWARHATVMMRQPAAAVANVAGTRLGAPLGLC